MSLFAMLLLTMVLTLDSSCSHSGRPSTGRIQQLAYS